PATVVTLYLSGPVNARLAPKLMKELRPGTRIVSHAFDLGSWKPQQRTSVSQRPIFLWTVAAPSDTRRGHPLHQRPPSNFQLPKALWGVGSWRLGVAVDPTKVVGVDFLRLDLISKAGHA